MKATKILSLLLVLVLLVASFAACGDKKDDGGAQNTTVTTKPVEFQEIDLADVVEHADHTSVYEMIGSKVTADMVEETEDGLAYVTVDGVKYELGMDFLSMAMVYNTAVPANSKFANSDAIYNFWWKLYIQRWNYLVPEVPLYANQYFDLYNAKIENFVTTPYWSPADAIVAATVKAIEEALKSGDKVQLIGFGTFEVKEVAAKTGRNPKTGEQIEIAACKKPSFSAAKALKDAVN